MRVQNTTRIWLTGVGCLSFSVSAKSRSYVAQSSLISGCCFLNNFSHSFSLFSASSSIKGGKELRGRIRVDRTRHGNREVGRDGCIEWLLIKQIKHVYVSKACLCINALQKTW